MRIAVLIPDRLDRPRFSENCLRMMKAQTLQPQIYQKVDFPPTDNDIDITKRYRVGYDALRGKGLDLIAFIENDDWYAPDYLETMVAAWERFHRPELLGTNSTIYYHIQLKAYSRMDHNDRASMMNTFIKPDLTFPWCVDLEPYTDLHLWKSPEVGKVLKNRIVFNPDKLVSIGIKHGVGKTIPAGRHVVDDRVRRSYHIPDNGFLKETLDAESFEFYNNYFQS